MPRTTTSSNVQESKYNEVQEVMYFVKINMVEEGGPITVLHSNLSCTSLLHIFNSHYFQTDLHRLSFQFLASINMMAAVLWCCGMLIACLSAPMEVSQKKRNWFYFSRLLPPNVHRFVMNACFVARKIIPTSDFIPRTLVVHFSTACIKISTTFCIQVTGSL